MTIHNSTSYTGSGDTSGVELKSVGVSDVHGRMSSFLGYVAEAIITDGDLYWHSENNLRNGDEAAPFVGVMWRRLTYLMGQIGNICSVNAYYTNKIPRRNNVSWGAVRDSVGAAWR
jgi:hypothetical protein